MFKARVTRYMFAIFMQNCKIVQNATQYNIEIQFESLIELQMWLIQQQEKYEKK